MYVIQNQSVFICSYWSYFRGKQIRLPVQKLIEQAVKFGVIWLECYDFYREYRKLNGRNILNDFIHLSANEA